jgi:hypothetical protein
VFTAEFASPDFTAIAFTVTESPQELAMDAGAATFVVLEFVAPCEA